MTNEGGMECGKDVSFEARRAKKEGTVGPGPKRLLVIDRIVGDEAGGQPDAGKTELFIR